MKVHVDRAVCEIHAQCVFAAPDVFSLDEDDELVYDPEPGDRHLAAVQQAAAVCPVSAISLTED